MSEAALSIKEDPGIDRPLIISIIMLLGIGVVMVYSASAVRAAQEQNNESFFLTRQAIHSFIGLAALLVGSRINYLFYRKIVYPLLGMALAGLVLCHTPIGLTINGAARWINMGVATFQPAELVKLALVIWLSYSLAKKQEKIKSFSVGFLPHLLVPGIAMVLCLMQPDFGTAAVLAAVTFVLLFIAGAKLGYMLLACIAAAPVFYYLVAGSDYRLKRVLAFLDPISSRYEHGYQLTQSLFGFSAGGFFGTGIGDGLQKFFFLPEAHNDFIAAIIAEELGTFGIWILMLIFAVAVARGVVISLRSKDEFGMYMAFGITILIAVQVLANLSVAMGLLPTKGLNLPFISYGGTSLVVSLFSVGILLNISKGYRPLPGLFEKRPATGQQNTRRSDSLENGDVQ